MSIIINLLIGLIPNLPQLIKMLKERSEKKKGLNTIAIRLENHYKKFNESINRLLELLFGSMMMGIVLDHSEYKNYLSSRVDEMKQLFDDVAASLNEIIEILYSTRKTLEEVLSPSEYAIIEPIIRMREEKGKIDIDYIYRTGYFTLLFRKKYGDEKKYMETVEKNFKYFSKKIKKKLHPVFAELNAEELLKTVSLIVSEITKMSENK